MTSRLNLLDVSKSFFQNPLRFGSKLNSVFSKSNLVWSLYVTMICSPTKIFFFVDLTEIYKLVAIELFFCFCWVFALIILMLTGSLLISLSLTNTVADGIIKVPSFKGDR